QVYFSDLKGPETIPASHFTCFNTGGIDSHGQPFTKKVDVKKGKVQAMWIGLDVPEKIQPGWYDGMVKISAIGEKPKTIHLKLKISDQYLANRGDNQPWRFSRLRWLNSTVGISDQPIAPFTKISFNNRGRFSL